MSRPAVLFVSHDASLTGAPACLGELLGSFAATAPGFEPIVFVRGDGPLLPAWRATGVRVEAHPRRAGIGPAGKLHHRLSSLVAYVRLLLETRPRLVYSNTVLNGPEVVIARLLGARTLVHVHEGAAMMRRHRIALLVSSWFTTRYVCVSAYAARALRGVAGADGVVVPNGMDAGIAAAADGAAVAAGRELVLGMVGAVMRSKGHDIVLQAVAKLRAERRAVRLRIFGQFVDEPYRRELERLVADLHIGDCVELAGLVSDRDAIYAAIDILVLASHEESFGRVILEAFAYGRTVVASNVGGVGEIIEDERNGLLAGLAPEEFASAVRRLQDDPGLRRRLSAAAAADVKQRFPLAATLARLRTEIDALLGARPL